MKMFITMSLILSTLSSSACRDVQNYYPQIENMDSTGALAALSKVIKSGHRTRHYDDLIDAYMKYDKDYTYENDGSLMDIYSENPHGGDRYNYKSKSRKCGNYSGEGTCFNREHIFPQGLFHKRAPMRSDYFHVLPTDGKVNGMRSSYAFGEVGEARWVSRNGSKLGKSKSKEFGGIVFEPIDEFKGDVARALFYFAARYHKQTKGFKDHAMLDKSSDKVYSQWFIDTLKTWHKNDPVSRHELSRNEGGCRFQGNRNPFIDRPEFVEAIW